MKFRIMLVLLVLVTPAVTSALGLGELELQSALNQPFKARVKLLSVTADELDGLKISLAEQEAFDRAGIQRTFLLTRLRFAIQESETGPDYIQIRSSETIREPFLNFLLEINWAKGRLFREYTVLLDPPTYNVPGSRKKALIHPQTPIVEIDSDDHQVVYDLEYKSESKTTVSQPAPVTPSYEPLSSYEEPATIFYAGSGDYGPAVTGDTLWSIAKVARPDSSVSIQQMMLAILNANPDAFIENNINGLKRGAILQIPDSSEIDSLNQADVLAQVNSQHALWDEYKAYVSADVSQRPESDYGQATEEVAEEPGDIEQDFSVTDVEETSEAELRLISESEQGSGSDQSSADSAGVDVDSLNNELALANESIEALFLENAELKDKLTETEGIIDDLKRLIVLKEDELAAMQEQIMVAAAEQESAEEEAEEEFVEEIEEVAEEEIESELAEGDAEEEMEPEASESEEMIVEEDITPSEDSGLGDLFGLMGLVEKAKANLMIIGSAVGGLLLLVFLMIFASRRRSAKATVKDLPVDDSPDFDDVSADETIKADALSEDVSESDSESVTDIPGSEDETILPGDDSDDVVGDADSFEIPEESAAEIPEQTETISAAAEEPEDDPMEEVNVFLAYEHFDEAESFVRQAMEKDPENMDFHSKLLEVFYAANNKKSYEEAAKVVHDKTGGQGEYWGVATVMWQEMSPNRALFETPADGEEEEGSAESTGSGVLNIAAESDATTDTGGMDLDIGGGETGEDMLDVTAAADMDSIPSESEDSGNDLDFSLDNDDTMGLSVDESNELLDDTIQMEASDVDQIKAQEDVDELDISIGDAASEGEEDMLDISIAEESGDVDELDISIGDAASEGEEDMLDISIAEESDDVDELDMSIGDTPGEGGEDLLDVTSAIDFESEGEEDLLDVTTATSAGVDSSDLLEQEGSDDDIDLDLESSDTDNIVDLELDASDEMNDINMDIPELEIEPDAESSLDDGGIDMESTVQMPSVNMEDLSMANDDDDEDKTFLVPKSTNVDEQSEDEEMASQLDLAKAYIELGDTENAKKILDEIISQGSDTYRKQAEELMGQIH